jgi:ABC-type sugar transport system permease subunit
MDPQFRSPIDRIRSGFCTHPEIDRRTITIYEYRIFSQRIFNNWYYQSHWIFQYFVRDPDFGFLAARRVACPERYAALKPVRNTLVPHRSDVWYLAFIGWFTHRYTCIPTIVSVAEDALNTVPRSYREASLALGATPWQTIWGTTLPAARSGVLTAIMLGIGRVIGETMAVMMVTGNAPILPSGLNALFSPVRTMTATIASEMGEVARGSEHYQVLFFIGIVLFAFSLLINVTAFIISSRSLKRSERLLS